MREELVTYNTVVDSEHKINRNKSKRWTVIFSQLFNVTTSIFFYFDKCSAFLLSLLQPLIYYFKNGIQSLQEIHTIVTLWHAVHKLHELLDHCDFSNIPVQ